MQEFWFCESCKSMNRGSSEQCYRCHAPKNLSTMATVTNRQPGVVLTPGLDEEHRDVAWTLMLRQKYISAWKLGYVAAALLFLVLAAGVAMAAAEIGFMVSRGSPTPIAPVDAHSPVLTVVFFVLLLTGVCAAVVHSVFLGLTSMDAPALGSGSPAFDPVRAGLWWIESSLWAIRAGLAFVGPPLLCLFAVSIGGLIFGIPIGVVWALCAFWLLGDPITSLGKPGRLLKDLWERLGVPGSANSRIVTLWTGVWGTARGFDFAVSGFIYVAIVVLAVARLLGSRFGVSIGLESTNGLALATILMVDFVVVVQWLTDGIALYLLALITIELSRRQRTREKWVLGGLASVPAPSGAAFASPTGASYAAPIAGMPAGSYGAVPQRPVPATWGPAAMPLAQVAPAPPPAVSSTPLTPPPKPHDPTSPEAVEERPVIQPSPSNLSRYKKAFERDPRTEPRVGSSPVEPVVEPPAGSGRSVEAPAEDLGWGEGL